MSLKIGTSVESHLSMICKQTTHFAILLSLFEKPRMRDRIKASAMRVEEGPA